MSITKYFHVVFPGGLRRPIIVKLKLAHRLLHSHQFGFCRLFLFMS